MDRREITRIEAWALNIIDRVKNRNRVEDSRVELKRDWISAEKCARLIAGHSNAMHGNETLWIFGLDEVVGIIGVEPSDLANWWPKVCAQFDGISPSVTDVILEIDQKSLLALAFDNSRLPFVVKNPVFEKPDGGPVSLEVPWREGTSVRTATRNDLVRLLSTVSLIPHVEIIKGTGSFGYFEDIPAVNATGLTRLSLRFYLSLFVSPQNSSPITIPFHRCCCRISATGEDEIINARAEFNEPTRTEFSAASGSVPGNIVSVRDSLSIRSTSTEAHIQGSGKGDLKISVEFSQDAPKWLTQSDLSLSITLAIAESPLPISLQATAILTPKSAVSSRFATNMRLANWNVQSIVYSSIVK